MVTYNDGLYHYRKVDGLPQFNEWFEDYGMNKVTHVMELRAAGYGINYNILMDITWSCM